MTRNISLLLLAMLITVTLAGVLEGNVDGDIPPRTSGTPQWAMPGGGPQNSHNVSMNYSGLEPYIKWGAEPITHSDMRCGSPVISGDGHIYFTRGPELFKVDPEGEMTWSLDLSIGEEAWNLSDPALDRDGNIIVWYGNGDLYSISPEGDILWTRITDRLESDGIVHPVPVDDKIYFNGVNRLYSFNLTGDIDEEIIIEPEYLIYYPVVDMNGTIYVVTIENDLIAYHANGTLFWTLSLSGKINSPPTVRGDGNIYLSEKVDLGINLHCIYRNGTRAWTTIIDYGDIGHRPVSVDSLGNAYLVIEFWGKSDRMYCVNSSGSIVWSKSLGGQVDRPVWVSDNGTVLIQMENSLHLIEYPGVLVHELRIATNLSGVGGMAFDHDGNIYLVRGTLYCIGMIESSPPSFIGGRIEDQLVDEDEGLIMDLYHLFSDAGGLAFEYECDNTGFNVTIYDDLILFTFPANYSGQGNARIKAISSGDDGEFGTTDDTFAWTNWFEITVLPVNDPPLLVEMEFPGADEGAMYHHDLQILDNDSDVDFTTVRIEGADWLYAKGHALEGIPPRNDIRSDSFDLLLIDEHGGVSRYTELNIDILDVNDPPYLEDRDPSISFLEDTSRRVDVGTTWYEDITFGDPEYDTLTFTVTAGAHLTIEYLHSPSNGIDFIVESDEDWYGFSNVTLTASDGEYTITVVIPVEVTGRRDPLRDLVIIPDIPLEEVDDSTLITLTCEFIDPDLGDHDYDDYRYYWYSNISGDLGEEREVSFYLEPGEHRIELQAWRPSSYSSTITFLEINVSDDGIDNTPGSEDEVEDYPDDDERFFKAIRDVTLVHLLIFGFFLLVPLYSFLIHIAIKKARSGKTTGEIPQGDPPGDEGNIKEKEVEE